MSLIRTYYFLAVVLLLTGCQTFSPPATLEGYGHSSVASGQFKHLLVYQDGSASKPNPPRLHVYIEGDGIPFIYRFLAAKDPSPRYPMMLAMMKQDVTPSLYLGRPCYFSRSLNGMEDPQCNSHYWKDARYSEEVVTSMVNALRQQLNGKNIQGVTLIGHSGGGTLATLMAARMPEVDQLVTLAANFDTRAWTRYHRYSALKKSLNPAAYISAATPMPKWQLHFAGAMDDNIPPALGQDFLAQMAQSYQIIPDADHNCCWFTLWPQLLARINQQLETAQPPR